MTESCSTGPAIEDHVVVRQAQSRTGLGYQDRASERSALAAQVPTVESWRERKHDPIDDIGSDQMRCEVAERAANDRIVGAILATHSAEPRIKSVLSFRRNTVVRRISGLAADAIETASATLRTATLRNRTKQRRCYPSRREIFIQDAAMEREMFRL